MWLPHLIKLFDTYVFDYFFVNTQFWNAKFQDVNDKNMSHLLVKSSKSCGKSGGQKGDLVKHLGEIIAFVASFS